VKDLVNVNSHTGLTVAEREHGTRAAREKGPEKLKVQWGLNKKNGKQWGLIVEVWNRGSNPPLILNPRTQTV